MINVFKPDNGVEFTFRQALYKDNIGEAKNFYAGRKNNTFIVLS